MIAARKSSPLVIGVGEENEFFVASDATPIIEYTRNVVYLEDEEIAKQVLHTTKGNIQAMRTRALAALREDAELRDCLKTNDNARVQTLITDEILDQFAVVARWDDVADRMIARYKGIAARLVIYLASHWREIDTNTLARWGEVARAVRKAA